MNGSLIKNHKGKRKSSSLRMLIRKKKKNGIFRGVNIKASYSRPKA